MILAKRVWPSLEGERVFRITNGFRGRWESAENVIIAMVHNIKNFKTQPCYFAKYIFCNFVAVSIVLGQAAFYLYQFDWFNPEHGGYSFSDVYTWMYQDVLERDDPLIKYFPRKLSCTVFDYGPSGYSQSKEYICYSSFNADFECVHVVAFLLLLVLVAAILLNLVYTFLCICFISASQRSRIVQNVRDRSRNIQTALNSLSDSQRFFFLLVCNNVGTDVEVALLEQMAADTPGTEEEEASKENIV
jgi:hypothetical protein